MNHNVSFLLKRLVDDKMVNRFQSSEQSPWYQSDLTNRHEKGNPFRCQQVNKKRYQMQVQLQIHNYLKMHEFKRKNSKVRSFG